MFKWYGLVGVLMIAFAQANFYFRIEPFASWYFPIIWYGFILTIDALVYNIRGNSLISNRFYRFLGLVIISTLFWWVFEFTNYSMGNWSYSGLEGLSRNVNFFGAISFSTVLPAFFEMTELIKSIHLFDDAKLKRKHKISKRFLHTMMIAGILCLILPLALPEFAFPLIWLSFFLILDPINYMNRQPSIIKHLKDRKLKTPLSLLLAGIMLGFLWEFWNYWAIPKWTYNIPYIGFWKVFEMPILGYLGYLPFAFELYAMYWFVRSLFLQKEPLLAN